MQEKWHEVHVLTIRSSAIEKAVKLGTTWIHSPIYYSNR
jgi:hypothetical protein